MHELVAADHVAGLKRIVVALDTADDATGFAQDELSPAISHGCRLRSQ